MKFGERLILVNCHNFANIHLIYQLLATRDAAVALGSFRHHSSTSPITCSYYSSTIALLRRSFVYVPWYVPNQLCLKLCTFLNSNTSIYMLLSTSPCQVRRHWMISYANASVRRLILARLT